MASAANAALITGIGMVTPAGCSASAACAAIQAGITRFAELGTVMLPSDDGTPTPVVGSSIQGVTDGTRGLGRFTRLAADALRDLMETAGLPESGFATTGFYLALPPPDRPAVDPRLVSNLGARLERWCQIKDAAARTRLFPAGHAAFIEALAAALVDLGRGTFTAAVVGGVDSLVEPETVRFLHAQGRLKTPDTKVGLIPGEGAAFALIETPARARARGATALCSIEAPSTAIEPVTITSRDPCDGSGLSAAMTQTLSALDDQGAETSLLLTDLNGEPYRAEELGYAMVRALSNVPLLPHLPALPVRVKPPLRIFHAADCIGDTGAASSAIAACSGARALHRGYARTSHALLCASSDGGLRGTAYLRALHQRPASTAGLAASKERGR
jgi:3-oxoacyl-[acyl-carrier-protein] synthase I